MLEEKLESYVDISKQMLTKMEKAVEKISESNSNISQILVRHDERLEYMSEYTESYSEKINKVEAALKEEINGIKKDIEDMKKTRWLWSGIVIACCFFLVELDLASKIFPTQQPNAEQTYSRQR